MAKRKQVTLDNAHHSEIEKLRTAYRKAKQTPPSLPYLCNRAIGHGLALLKAEVTNGLNGSER